MDAALWAALAAGFAAGLGLPRWILGFLKRRREAKFIAAFPDGVDVIVRGIKAGLPLLESLKIIAAERDAFLDDFQQTLGKFNDPRGLYARLPFELRLN